MVADQVTYHHARAVASALFAIYALPQGIPVGPIKLGGIGQHWNERPFRGCFPVFIGSDSEGKFGYQCPQCAGYWRADGGAMICPYCGTHAAVGLVAKMVGNVHRAFHEIIPPEREPISWHTQRRRAMASA